MVLIEVSVEAPLLLLVVSFLYKYLPSTTPTDLKIEYKVSIQNTDLDTYLPGKSEGRNPSHPAAPLILFSYNLTQYTIH